MCSTPATGIFKHLRHEPNDPDSLLDDRIQKIELDRSGTVLGVDPGGIGSLAARSPPLRPSGSRSGRCQFPGRQLDHARSRGSGRGVVGDQIGRRPRAHGSQWPYRGCLTVTRKRHRRATIPNFRLPTPPTARTPALPSSLRPDPCTPSSCRPAGHLWAGHLLLSLSLSPLPPTSRAPHLDLLAPSSPLSLPPPLGPPSIRIHYPASQGRQRPTSGPSDHPSLYEDKSGAGHGSARAPVASAAGIRTAGNWVASAPGWLGGNYVQAFRRRTG